MMKCPFVFLSENGLYFSNIACRFQTNYKQNSAKFIMEFAPFFDIQKGTFSFSATVVLPNVAIMYSNFRNYAPLLDVKGGIIAEKVVPVFSESSFLACFGLVM